MLISIKSLERLFDYFPDRVAGNFFLQIRLAYAGLSTSELEQNRCIVIVLESGSLAQESFYRIGGCNALGGSSEAVAVS